VTIEATDTFRKSLTGRCFEQVTGLPRGDEDGHGVEGLAELVESVVSQRVDGDTHNGVGNGRIRELLELQNNIGIRFNSNTTDLNTTVAEVSSHRDVDVGEFGHGHHDEDTLAGSSAQHAVDLGFDVINNSIFFSGDLGDHLVQVGLNFTANTSHAAAVRSRAIVHTITDLEDTNTISSCGSVDGGGFGSVGERSVVGPFTESFNHGSKGHAFTTSREQRVDGTINQEDDIHVAKPEKRLSIQEVVEFSQKQVPTGAREQAQASVKALQGLRRQMLPAAALQAQRTSLLQSVLVVC